MTGDDDGTPPDPDPATVLADVEHRATHPAYRQQKRRMIGFALVDIRPGDERPILLCACVADGCGALYRPGDPRMVTHHETHRRS